MAGLQLSTGNSRFGAEVAIELLNQMGYNTAQANPTQSYLRSEMALSTTTQNYYVPILTNDTTNGATAYVSEKRLNLQDVFVPLEFGLFVAAPANATAPANILYTYPNTSIFTGGSAAALQTLWSGNMTIINNNIQVVPAWDLWRHYKAPATQQAANAGYTSSGVNLVDSFNGSVDGFYPVAPSFVLSGANKFNINLNLPAAISSVLSNSRIVTIFRGILLQNVTSVR